MRINFVNHNLKTHFPDQLAPFEHSPFNGFDGKSEYPGSLFRIPFRTAAQAEVSEIARRREACTPEQVHEMCKALYDEAVDLLLFTQHLECIELYELGVPPRGFKPLREVLQPAGSRRCRYAFRAN